MMNGELTKDDCEQIKRHGLSLEAVERQLSLFQRGILPVNLEDAATLDNGIVRLSNKELKNFEEKYDSTERDTVKFIPASGSATRMFKLLHRFLLEFDSSRHDFRRFLETDQFKPLKPFFDQLEALPFYPLVNVERQTYYPGDGQSSEETDKINFVRYLMDEMAYGSLPKGLIPFHRYDSKIVSAFEEHFYEAAEYNTHNGKSRLHFTVSDNHLEAFKSAYENFKSRLKKETDIDYEVSYSFQEKSTDTIAVDQHNHPFRFDNGKLLIRPGGHGALIQNLNRIDADIVFIKNIDNVVPTVKCDRIASHKKALAGVLIEVQEKVFKLLEQLDEEGKTPQLIARAENLAEERFHQTKRFETEAEIRRFFYRPIRVCGMVENKGEPGGGPFWVKSREGTVSLQIVEGAQIDADDERQQAILSRATHFNPVDIVAGIKNYKGEKFDLTDYVKPEEGFITHKSIEGKPLKALELPGLWNGAMAEWNTIFVEVPLVTFNPVKTVTDLLKPGHQVDGVSQ